MVFSSLEFLYIFLPCCLMLYFAMPGLKAKNHMLTVLSLLFYAWGEPVWVCLLVFSAFTDYVCGRMAGKYRGAWGAKAALIASIVINLGLLCTFKYMNFFLENIGLLLRTGMPSVGLTMPIGISFYTFQTLSYTIDVYRGKVPVQRSFASFLLFVSLFPQLIAGPILRYSEIAEQIENRRCTFGGMASGLARFMAGLGKKVLIANFAGRTADLILGGDLYAMTALDAWIGMLCFTFQIYFDFSGYSDMAIGLGRIFGFRYGENFRYPYISRSITEFWRRWHISLGSFFRDYVYIPMGGNRRLHVRNILAVWLLTGLWHGASWNFVLWGLYYGVLLVIEKFALKGRRVPAAPALLVTFFLTVMGWVLFYFTDLTRAGATYMAMFGIGHDAVSRTALVRLMNNLPLLALAAVAATPLPAGMAGYLRGLGLNISPPRAGAVRAGLTAAAAAALLGLSTVALVGDSYNPFLYFRF
ncbi:MAG: MBOAT family protein [Oscillospiraceae bacterium]|nr:MBOAT family protein [Oscillospiraceae bacterium]